MIHFFSFNPYHNYEGLWLRDRSFNYTAGKMVKLYLFSIKHWVRRKYGGVEIQLHTFLNSTLEGYEWSASLSWPLYAQWHSSQYPPNRRLDWPLRQSVCTLYSTKVSPALLKMYSQVLKCTAHPSLYTIWATVGHTIRNYCCINTANH
jgi:hypothetical protein